MILKHCVTTSCNPLTYLVIVRKFTCHFYWFWHKMASMLPPIIRFDRFALVKKKHDKDVVELKIRFADFRYHKIRAHSLIGNDTQKATSSFQDFCMMPSCKIHCLIFCFANLCIFESNYNYMIPKKRATDVVSTLVWLNACTVFENP